MKGWKGEFGQVRNHGQYGKSNNSWSFTLENKLLLLDEIDCRQGAVKDGFRCLRSTSAEVRKPLGAGSGMVL